MWVANTIAALGAAIGLAIIILVIERWREQRPEWVEWNGGSCPIPPDAWVEVKHRNGFVCGLQLGARGVASYEQRGLPDDIVAYRILKG